MEWERNRYNNIYIYIYTLIYVKREFRIQKIIERETDLREEFSYGERGIHRSQRTLPQFEEEG